MAMDLLFQPSHGNPFSIEVGYFDTVLEIKEKIQKYQGIPVSKQTLILNSDTLPDDLIVCYSEIMDCSRINLLISPDADPTPPPPPPSTKIQLLVKVSSSGPGKPLGADIHDTIQGLKEKIQEMVEGVHASRIVVHANGTALQDSKTVKECGLSDNSEIYVAARRQSSTKIRLLVKVSSSEPRKPLEADIHDTIQRVKGKIQEMERVPASLIVVHANGTELQDFKTVKQSGLSDNSEINVAFRSVPLSSSSRQSSTKMIRVFVLTYRGKEKVPVKVSPLDIVGGLREKMEKMKLDLPKEYFFIHKQSVMEDDMTFEWHEVCQGDTIEIFPGWVSRKAK